jgi:carboxyl-terminal processing protease
MNEFKASGLSKLIIDLRGNPGGYLNAANLIASHFLPANEVIVTEDYQQKQPSIVHRVTAGNSLINQPKLSFS